MRTAAPSSAPAVLPRISIVTAVYNGEQYLEATIESILGQNYPNLEYIVVDDGSTDGTAEIIRKYEPRIACVIRQANQGLYPALNAGFARTTGEIMGWLNSSDMLQINGLFVVGGVFSSFREVEWITGRPTKYNPSGQTVNIWPVPHWSRLRFLAGANKFIQQESTYWRRGLWQRAGGYVHEGFRAEGDFELWVRFFRHAQLYSVDALIGGYRAHENALSAGNQARYDGTCDSIADRELAALAGARPAKLFRSVSRFVKPIPKVRGAWQRVAMRSLYRLPAADLPPTIRYGTDYWYMEE
jgi:glycosyltransferase involved in cell wall biosynthesis